MKDLTLKQIYALKPGPHRVSESLYVQVAPDAQTRRFKFRYTKPATDRVSETGLGRLDKDTTLKEAKAKRDELRRLVRQGIDPVEQKRGARIASVTFATVVADYMAVQERRYRNPNSARDEHRLLLTHAGALGSLPVANIGTSHINSALRPLWLRAPDQARRTMTAVIRVLRHAKASGHAVMNVAEIREDVQHLFPPVNGIKRHQKEIKYPDVPAFVRELRAHQVQGEALSPFVIEFILLTGCRENEACGMQWREIDWQERVWTLPLERDKIGHKRKTDAAHRVPLSDRAIMLLIRQRGPEAGVEPDPNAYVWPGRSGAKPVTGKSVYKYLTETMGVKATIHGMRATFRTWAGNETHFDRVTSELALGHLAGDAVELAYRRGDALAKRRQLMDAWSAYCAGK
jgi:integrase